MKQLIEKLSNNLNTTNSNLAPVAEATRFIMESGVLEQLAKHLPEVIALIHRNFPADGFEKPDSDPLHDAKYAAGRIGVVDRTLRRLTHKGLLPVHTHFNGKRWFRESDIERCRRYYRGE